MRASSSASGLAALVALTCATAAGCVSASALAHPQPFPGTAPPAASSESRAVSRRIAASVVQSALSLRGAAYRLGGDAPAVGFDCSGLVRYVFEQERVAVPRTVSGQFLAGARVTDRDIEAGDLVFFATTTSGPTHVGIAVDRTRFVHAPGTGGVVRVEPLTTPYWSKRLVGVRRLTTQVN